MFLVTAVVQLSGPYFSKQPVKVTAPEGHLSGHAGILRTPPCPRRARAQDYVFSVQGPA